MVQSLQVYSKGISLPTFMTVIIAFHLLMWKWKHLSSFTVSHTKSSISHLSVMCTKCIWCLFLHYCLIGFEKGKFYSILEKKSLHVTSIFAGRHVYYCGYRKADSGPVKRRLVIEDKEEMKRILEEVHDKDGHGGTRSTQFKVTEKYYWPTITSDIQDWVSWILNLPN